jgi:acetyl esterase/lipase
MIVHPVNPLTRIKRVQIPRRQDIQPQIGGLKPDLEEDLMKAEWIKHNGYFRNIKTVEGGWADPSERVILFAHGGLYCTGSPLSHRGICWRLSKHSNARVLCKILKKLINNKSRLNFCKPYDSN